MNQYIRIVIIFFSLTNPFLSEFKDAILSFILFITIIKSDCRELFAFSMISVVTCDCDPLLHLIIKKTTGKKKPVIKILQGDLM